MGEILRKEEDLLVKTEKFVVALLSALNGDFIYHNADHTRRVVKAAEEIGKKSRLNSAELENVLIAAWFHDTGYSCCSENHEAESARIMRQKLTEWQVPEERIRIIEEIILATQMPQTPGNLMCKIICDADLYHLAEPDFPEKSESLRKEINHVCNKKINPREWAKITFEFISTHCYFTNYGKKVLAPRKEAIVNHIRERFQSVVNR